MVGDIRTRNNVQERGRADGPALVFAHGFGCDQSMWRLVAPAFEATHRVILFDYVGCGGSDLEAWSPERYASLGGYAEDVLDVLAELDLRDVVFVGHSVSATIGALAAIREPSRFARLVFVGPSPRYVDDDGYTGGFSAADVEELLATLDDNWLGWADAMAPVISGNPEQPEVGAELTASFCRTAPDVASSFARATFLADNRADLPHVPVPVLVLQCADDVIAPQAVGEYVHAALPQSELVLMEARGHCPQLSSPDETIGAIARVA
jgi:sigma-B regulation protein RsbQ